MQKKRVVLVGTIRVLKNGCKVVEKTHSGWKKSKKNFLSLQEVVKLYKTSNNIELLIDSKNPKFLKGQVSKEGKIKGARINILPNGEKIDKAFSLFADELKLHDQLTGDHWDVLFKNKGGTYAYCYNLEKIAKHRKQKYNKVKDFDKRYKILLKNVTKGLKNKEDHLALPIYTLLKTYMRVGNEMYYNLHGHKGLTTLKKKDVSIKGNTVSFKYLGKDGVPRNILHKFPKQYIQRLKSLLKKKKNTDFVFSSCKTSHPLHEQIFKRAFFYYCGKEFYPHIVRSHFATKTVSDYIKGKRKLSKQEVKQLYDYVAHELGHKKFSKKKKEWVDSSAVTVRHYIDPELVNKVEKRIV